MMDTQRHPTDSSTMKWKAQKDSARAVPSGGSSHSLPAEQPARAVAKAS